MGGIFIKIRAWWETADRTQRVVSIFGSAFLVLLLGATFYFATKPKMTVIYGGLPADTMGKVVAEIQGMGITTEYDTVSGTVKVPDDKKDEVKTKLAMSNTVPLSAHASTGDLKGIGLINSPKVEEAQLIAIQQGEIARTLEGIESVQSATVLLNPGQIAGFASEDIPASASVTITPKGGYDISPDSARAMASLVSKAVANLKTKDVTIVDSSGTTLFDGSQEGIGSSANKKIASEIAEARRIRNELQPVLDRWCGPGRTIITAKVTQDWDETKEDSVINRPSEEPIASTTVTETVNGGGTTSSGTLAPAGVTANTGNGNANTTNTTGANSGYTGQQKDEQRAVDTIHTEKVKTPGTTTNIALSVVINTAPIKPATGQKPEDIPQPPSKSDVEQFLNGHLGLVKDATGNYQLKNAGKDAPTYTVTVVESAFHPIDNSGVQAAASEARTQQIFSLLPIAALFIVAFVVIKAIGKVAKSKDVMVTAIAGGHILPGSGAAALTMGGRSLAPLAPGETEDLAEDETWVEEEDEETQRPVRKKKKKVDVGEIDEKLNIPLEQIRKMADERPDTVALLLKSWLTEERR